MKKPLPKDAQLIPDTARKVFTGKLFDVYQWEQELFDGSYKTFEMLKRPDTVLVLGLDEYDQVVTLNEEQPGVGSWRYSMPGGRVDAEDASLVEAAQREMREETGYEFAAWQLIDTLQPQRKIEWFIYVFVAQGITKRGVATPDAGERPHQY